MFYPDLTGYVYGDPPADCVSVLNVGWLDISQEYRSGVAPNGLANRFAAIIEHPINMTRDFHPYSFCADEILARMDSPNSALLMETLSGLDALGNGEILVAGPDGVCYIAPRLVLHYGTSHDYLPPDRFIDAVLHDVGARALPPRAGPDCSAASRAVLVAWGG